MEVDGLSAIGFVAGKPQEPHRKADRLLVGTGESPLLDGGFRYSMGLVQRVLEFRKRNHAFLHQQMIDRSDRDIEAFEFKIGGVHASSQIKFMLPTDQLFNLFRASSYHAVWFMSHE